MTARRQAAARGRGALPALVLALAAVPGGAADEPGKADGLDLPQQIAPETEDPAAIDELESAAEDPVGMEGLGLDGTRDPARVEQPRDPRDLCDPSVPQSVRDGLGIDCEALGLPLPDAPRARPGTARDPLLTPRDRKARDRFEALELGDDVPPTILLQK
jgi:hypothetical protein